MRLTRGVSGSVLVLLLALSGCGGDGSDDDKADSDDTSASASGGTSIDADAEDPADPDAEGDDGAEGGEGSGDEVRGDQVDVCDLVSPADLEAAFGSPFGEGEFTHQEQTGGDQCVWSSDTRPIKLFSATILREGHLEGALGEAGASVQQLHKDSRALVPDAEDVDLGDDAYLWGTTLSVLDGDTSYTFTTTSRGSAEAIAAMKTLAEQIVG